MSGQNFTNFCGRTVGRFDVLEQLGSGGFGIVYRAVCDGKEYALKCILRGAPGTRESECFQREWGASLRLDTHPGIVRAHAYFSHHCYIFLVFDLFTGGDLFTNVIEKFTYYRDDALVKKAFLSLLDAVEHCHAQGVFHQDIKLENVLCSADGSQLSLADFGLATDQEHSIDYGVGSIDYKSPESLREAEGGLIFSVRRLDLWALGILLLNMISCRSPWDEAHADHPAYLSFRSDPQQYLRGYLPISDEAVSFFARVFALDPWQRPSLAEMRSAVMNMKRFYMTDEEFVKA
ncbi:kinase-like protein, partial [Auriscalpium vulgare]